jgi:hypothetical protein
MASGFGVLVEHYTSLVGWDIQRIVDMNLEVVFLCHFSNFGKSKSYIVGNLDLLAMSRQNIQQ